MTSKIDDLFRLVLSSEIGQCTGVSGDFYKERKYIRKAGVVVVKKINKEGRRIRK